MLKAIYNDNGYLSLNDELTRDDIIYINFSLLETNNLGINKVNFKNLKVIYEDDNIIAVFKRRGILVHSDGGNSDTLLDEVNNYLIYKGDDSVVRAIHRLDVDTCGIVIFSKNVLAHAYISKMMEENKIEKEYHCYVEGVIEKDGFVDIGIGRNRHDSKKSIAIKSGKNAYTEYKVLKNMVFISTEAVVYCETKEFPVQFDKDGNMLLKNIKSIDYDEEYRKSHNLLKEYYKNENTVGMKYELAKLWMILCIIENRVHSKKFISMPVEDQIASNEYKAKSKIMNDFKHYMKKLLELEPEFNFSEYFENSPFSSATIKLRATTVETVAKLLKGFIRRI